MSNPPAFPLAEQIESILELLAERCEDPTPLVYARLFERWPEMRAYFWRDTNDAVKGEMLARTFAAILDFVGERRYAGYMIGTEMVTHEGYDVPREVFTTFFEVIGDTAQAELGDDWSPDFAAAWREMLEEIDRYAAAVPRTDVVSPAFDKIKEQMQQRHGARSQPSAI